MQSERSAVSATFPYSSSFELASEQSPWYISFRFVTSCQFFPFVSQNKIELSKPQFGDAGHRSPYLSHAKQALYRLSYIPVPFKLRASLWTKFMIDQLSISEELSIPSHYQQTPNRIVEASKSFGDAGYLSHAKQALYHLELPPYPSSFNKIHAICRIPSHYQQTPNRIVEASKTVWRCGASIPVPLACEASAIHPRTLQALSYRTKAMYISFRFVTSCQFLPIISKHHIELSKPQKVLEMRGTDPRTSRMQSERSAVSATFDWTKSMIYQLSICNELSIPSHYQQTPNRIVLKNFWRCGASIPVPLACEASALPFATSPYPSSFELSSEQKPCISAFDL